MAVTSRATAFAGRLSTISLIGMACSLSLFAAVLPEDRFDALYHGYDGGGVEITGPSLLMRKQVGDSSSLSANYYVDSISSASIDVVTSASPYSEERTEQAIGIDFLRDNVIIGAGYSSSRENDYEADTYSVSISQDMFGDLTNVSLGYSLGLDTVGRRGQPDFAEDVRRHNYRLGVSQILTKNMLVDFGWETITDEGFLNNPYRSVRYLDPGSALGYSFESEVYPNTRDSNAVSLRALYYLPYRASLRGEYRWFNDSWGIEADTYEISYSHPIESGWTIDFRYRRYSQSRADFYSDLFPTQQAQNFLARDKELSTFSSDTVGLGVSYEFLSGGHRFIDRGSLNLSYDHIRFDYEDFRDLTVSAVPGQEPLYGFTADVTQLYLSIWY